MLGCVLDGGSSRPRYLVFMSILSLVAFLTFIALLREEDWIQVSEWVGLDIAGKSDHQYNDGESSSEMNMLIKQGDTRTHETYTEATVVPTLVQTASPVTPMPVPQIPSTSGPTSKESVDNSKDATEQNALLYRFIEENRGKPVLIVQADNRRLGLNTSLTSSYTHSSIVAHDLWARKHGYAYIWVTEFTEGPHRRKVLGYWNKVPASMLALRLARRAAIPRVVFIDSDSLPTEILMEKDCGLESMLERYNSHFVTSSEHEFWAMLLGGFKVYSKALNSGVFLFDTSDKSEQLIRHWWLIATNQSTPYELQRGRLQVVSSYNPKSPTLKIGDVLVSPSSTDVLASFMGLCKLHHNLIENKFHYRSNNSAEWRVTVEYVVRQNWSNGSATQFLEMRDACCGSNKTCSKFVKLANNETEFPEKDINIDVSCTTIPFDTFMNWPGDQDRLNWVVDKFFNGSKIVNDLGVCSGGAFRRNNICFHHFCNTKGAHIGNQLFDYLKSPRANVSVALNISRAEFDHRLGPEWLSQVWKLKTTTKAMIAGSETDDTMFRFEPKLG